MGWASGSYLACEVWEMFRKHIKNKEVRKELALKLYNLFREHDADDFSYDDRLLIDAGIKPDEY